MKILYEDKNVIVCVKPSGLLSEDTGNGDENIVSCVREYRESKGEDGYVGLLHRLDRNVGGAMAFSKNQKLTGKLSLAMSDKEICRKEYLAVVSGIPEAPEGVFCDLLFKDTAKGKVFVVDTERKGAKKASLSYRVIASAEGKKGILSLVRVRLHTGRTHQIRVQFASRGMPVVGDGKYGSREKMQDGIALFSSRLSLKLEGVASFDAESLPDTQVYPFSLFGEITERGIL